MNHAIISDVLWKIYSYFPHCFFRVKYKKNEARKNFDYKSNDSISIVAVNCIGSEIYSVLGLKFTTPFINTTISRKDFVRLCARFKEYMDKPLKVEKKMDGLWHGILEIDSDNKVDIIFGHDYNEEEIVSNWRKRKKRINYDKLVFICDDKFLEKEDYEIFDSASAYRKIMLTAKEHPEYRWCHQISQYKNKEYTGRYNFKSWKGGWQFLYLWDFVSFLNGEEYGQKKCVAND